MQNPTVSVVLPLADHRDQVSACLASFANQTIARERIEIVLAADGSDPDLEQEVAAAYPQCGIVRGQGNIPALYNAGAKAARGRYLFICEMHVVAEPDCLEEILRYAEEANVPCASVASDGINRNAFAACEERLVGGDLREWRMRGGKVTIRGFLIERRIWDRFGGLQPEYDHFAEVVLSRKLTQAGVKIGYAEKALVHHCNQNTVRGLSDELFAYGYGECRSYRFDPPADWNVIPREWKNKNRYLDSAATRRAGYWLTSLRLAWQRALLRVFPSTSEAYFRAYKRHWKLATRLGRLAYLAEMARERNAIREGEAPTEPMAASISNPILGSAGASPSRPTS